MAEDDSTSLSPAQDPRLIRQRLKELQSGLQVLKVQNDVHVQDHLISHLLRTWPYLTEEMRDEVFQDYMACFPRVLAAQHPRECFDQLMSLPSEEDCQRALRVRGELYQNYQADPGEEVYPSTGWLGRYLNYTKWNHVPLGFHFWGGVAALGAACRRNFYLDSGIYRLYPNFYIILAGKKDTGKSAGMEQSEDMVSRVNRQLHALDPSIQRAFGIHVFPEDITQEGLIKELTKLNDPVTVVDPEAGTAAFPGSTPLTGDATGIIFSDELSNLLGKGTYSIEKKVPFLTSIAYRSTYIKGTKGDGREEIHNLGMSILGCTAPEWLRNTIHSDALSGGFMDRTNFIFRRPSGRVYPPTDALPPYDPLAAEELARWLHKIARPPSGSKQMLEMRRDAKDFLEQWYRGEAEKGVLDEDDPRRTSRGRRTLQLQKMSMILCLSEYEMPWISLERVEQALRILSEEERWFEEFWDRATERSDARVYMQVKTYIVNRGRWVRGGEIVQRFKRQLGPSKVIRTILDTLVDGEELQRFGVFPKDIYGLPNWKKPPDA